MDKKVTFFLGANSPAGFYSLYDQMLEPAAARRVFLLKGGAGCGKSSLMRRVGAALEEAGEKAEYIVCSGDPGSLDAVVFPNLGAAIVDATAPQGRVTEGHKSDFNKAQLLRFFSIAPNKRSTSPWKPTFEICIATEKAIFWNGFILSSAPRSWDLIPPKNSRKRFFLNAFGCLNFIFCVGDFNPRRAIGVLGPQADQQEMSAPEFFIPLINPGYETFTDSALSTVVALSAAIPATINAIATR